MPKLFSVSLISFIVLHLFLINFNYAEWGDTYRILRASEYVRNLSYPSDEKRPPLFSAVLALRPENFDQISWGRIVMLFLSVIAFSVFYKLAASFLITDYEKTLAVVLFILNPVYLYWSLRIYADVPFSILCMLALLLYTKWKKSLSTAKVLMLSLIVSLSILTRFEGFILFVALGTALLFKNGFYIKKIDLNKLNIKQAGLYVVSTLLVIGPYLLYKNPFASKYLEEPENRAYDLKMAAVFLLSFLFVLGVDITGYVFLKSRKYLPGFFKENIHITVFLFLELLLILVWPAAIPRLFVPLIPVLIILFSKHLYTFLMEGNFGSKKVYFLATVFLLTLHIVGQYFLKLQFLVNIKYLLAVTVLFQLGLSVSLYFKKKYILPVFLIFSLSAWSFAVLYVHKYIYRSVKEAAVYAAQNFEGNVGYNDVSSVSDWYLNYYNGGKNNTGIYMFYAKKADLNYENLVSKKLDYLLMTNEHNTDTTLDIEQRPYLEQLVEFKYAINGKEFWTKVLKIKNYE